MPWIPQWGGPEPFSPALTGGVARPTVTSHNNRAIIVRVRRTLFLTDADEALRIEVAWSIGRRSRHTQSQFCWLGEGTGPLLLGCDSRPSPRGSVGGPSETRPTTGRVSDTLDLAAAIRLSAGDDITPQRCGVSSREESDNV